MALTVGQGSLQGVTFGIGTNYQWADPGPTGIGEVVKDQDVELDHDDGSYAGTDRKGTRVITLPFVVIGTDAANAMDNFETLAAAFAASATNVTLELYLPGKHFSVSGRPRGVVEDLTHLYEAVVYCLGTFVANNPTMTAL
jgi:hypothetical protein